MGGGDEGAESRPHGGHGSASGTRGHVTGVRRSVLRTGPSGRLVSVTWARIVGPRETPDARGVAHRALAGGSGGTRLPRGLSRRDGALPVAVQATTAAVVGSPGSTPHASSRPSHDGAGTPSPDRVSVHVKLHVSTRAPPGASPESNPRAESPSYMRDEGVWALAGGVREVAQVLADRPPGSFVFVLGGAPASAWTNDGVNAGAGTRGRGHSGSPHTTFGGTLHVAFKFGLAVRIHTWRWGERVRGTVVRPALGGALSPSESLLLSTSQRASRAVSARAMQLVGRGMSPTHVPGVEPNPSTAMVVRVTPSVFKHMRAAYEFMPRVRALVAAACRDTAFEPVQQPGHGGAEAGQASPGRRRRSARRSVGSVGSLGTEADAAVGVAVSGSAVGPLSADGSAWPTLSPHDHRVSRGFGHRKCSNDSIGHSGAASAVAGSASGALMSPTAADHPLYVVRPAAGAGLEVALSEHAVSHPPAAPRSVQTRA